MKSFITFILSLFGIKPTPVNVEGTTATVPPEEYTPEDIESILNDQEILPEPQDNKFRLPSKFALLIGINKYNPDLDANLNGCVNDVRSLYEILTDTYNFPHDNIRIITDYRATYNNIYDRIEWLLSHNVPGDELVLHYSGHGSQIRDRGDMDELNDSMDEILCPTDLDWDNPFTDDSIRHLFDMKGEGVNLTFICDSCHSGSISRSLIQPGSNDFEKPKFINPPVDIKLREGVKPLKIQKFAALTSYQKEISTSQSHVLLSGCRDDQTSSDAYIDGRWQGALTASLIKAIKINPNRDWTTIHADIIAYLNEHEYSQRPQLSGDDSLVKGRIIFGG